MGTMWPELIAAMPLGMGRMMRLLARSRRAEPDEAYVPVLFPRLLPLMLPKVLATMLRRVESRSRCPNICASRCGSHAQGHGPTDAHDRDVCRSSPSR